MRQFNLKEYLANPSKKVITRDGRNARIVCTNVKGRNEYRIAALIEHYDGTYENIYLYTKDGLIFSGATSEDDLFFAPKKYEGWTNVYINDDCRLERTFIYKSEEEAKAVGVGRKNYVATVKIEWEE